MMGVSGGTARGLLPGNILRENRVLSRGRRGHVQHRFEAVYKRMQRNLILVH